MIASPAVGFRWRSAADRLSWPSTRHPASRRREPVMADLTRVSISLEEPLLAAFDQLIAGKGYATRSEAISDLIRDRLVRDKARTQAGEQVAVVSVVYDHHARELASKLVDKQHHHHDL